MRKASARAAARGGLPNALFVQAPVEQLPPELTGVTELHVIMPWGSLLRAILGAGTAGPPVLARLAAACRPGARFRVALNLHAWHPPAPAVRDLPEPGPHWAHHELASRYAAAGWHLDQATYLDDAGIEALHSSWTRRLRSSRSGRFDVLALTGTIA